MGTVWLWGWDGCCRVAFAGSDSAFGNSHLEVERRQALLPLLSPRCCLGYKDVKCCGSCSFSPIEADLMDVSRAL